MQALYESKTEITYKYDSVEERIAHIKAMCYSGWTCTHIWNEIDGPLQATYIFKK